MTVQEYIISTLQSLGQPMPLEDIGNMPIEEAIYAKVMSKKFRKLKADDDTVAITKKAIKLAVQDKKPIVVSFCFGGNKLWRFEEAPEIDWAELFAVTYFIRWMKSIASVYKPGARLDFYSEDVAVELLNNVPKAETDKYSEGFISMLEWMKTYISNNVSITYRRYGDEYSDYPQYLAELEDSKKVVLSENNNQLPDLTELQMSATELNVKLLPGQADDPLWREKVELIHKSLERTETITRYFKDPALIPACPGWYPGLIVTGSTKKSLAKFWAGVGALEKDGDSFNELVLTPKQLELAQFGWEEVNIEGLTGKNFKKIRVLK